MKNNSTFFNVTPSFQYLKIVGVLLFNLVNLNAFAQFPGTDNVAGVGKTFPVPANVTHVNIAAWGAGGGGGGSNNNGSGGNGGGGGGAASSNQIAVNNISVFTYNISAGGAGGGATGGRGGNGGSTIITATTPLINFIANGGTGGLGNRANLSAGNSEGGGASGGVTNNVGFDGTRGALNGNSGNGGNSGTAFGIFGLGGTGLINNNGSPGGRPGAGGSGGEQSNNNNRMGGAGASGQVMFDFIMVSGVGPIPICAGGIMTITGNYFSAGLTTVTINGTACTNVTVLNATTITATVGIGSTSGVVEVINNGRRNTSQSITVNPSPTINLTSAVGTNNQSRCINTSIVNINYSITGGGVTGATVTGLPTGITGDFASGIFTISGIPTSVGTFVYTITTTGGSCVSTVTGSITVGALPLISLTSAPATANQSICRGSGIINSTYVIGGSATGVISSGLPPGVTGNIVGSNYTLSGTPTANGSFNYTLTTTGGICAGATINGVITVNALPTTPANPTSNSPQCNTLGVTITRVGTPPANETWYWQTTAGGTTTLNSGVTYVVNTSGTFYLRAQNNLTGCWSSGSGSVAVIINNLPNAVTAPVPASGSTGICYIGFGAVSAISWGAVANATSYDVYFGAGSVPATVSANVITNTFNTGVLLANTTYYWRIVAKNSCGNAVSSPTWSFTTNSQPCVCTATSDQPNGLYINSVAFVGALSNPPVNPSTFNATGFQNFTTLPTKAVQAQGEGINIIASATGNIMGRGTWKAWVDWNKNGVFDQNPLTEEVYNIYGFAGSDATFGFIVPLATPPGDYRIRIRVNNGTTFNGETFGFDFTPCSNFTVPGGGFGERNYGETEDYLFTVVAKCNSTITAISNGQNCGPGSVNLQATATSGVTEFRWYTSESGGSYVTSVPIGLSTTFTTPSLASTTNYYVTAWNGTCETQMRTLVVAKINPTPVVTFNQSIPAVCGESAILQLTAAGDKEMVHLINENFEAGTLGVFSNINNDLNNNLVKNNTSWKNQESTFVPNTNVWFPAISSGFGANKFALAYSDSKSPNYATVTVENSIALTNSVSTNSFLNLTLTIRLFYSRYFPNAYTDPTAPEYVNIEVSTDGGLTYPNVVQSFTSDVGIGTRFANLSYNLSAFVNQSNLKIRVRHRSFAGNGWLPDGVAIDNVELFGEKPLNTSFNYDTSMVDAFTNAAATTPYVPGTPATTIWIRPSLAQLQINPEFDIPVTATLANGCSATGFVKIINNTKVWDTATMDWATTNWKPSTSVPTADHCVIIKTPVILGATTSGFANNLSVQDLGNLTIEGNLTVTNFVNNMTGDASKLTLKSDANLLQINPSKLINTGSITAERAAVNIDYNPGAFIDYIYWSSPVAGQQTKGSGGFSPGTPNNRFFDYRESNDFFYETPDLTFIAAKGYAVQAEANLGTPYAKTYTFKGAPNNGDFSIPITKSADNPVGVVHGYNLIGNPYPSNIDFNELYLGNSALIYNSAWFWMNVSYQQYQMGSGYGGNNYAVLNGTGGVPYTANGKVSVGQGFIIQAKSNGNLFFKNSYSTGHDLRVGSSATFFQKENTTKNRFWIQLIAPSQIVNSQLIGYVDGATNDYEQDYDAEAFDNYSDLFYSKLPGKKLLIQGRGVQFSVEDRVPVGANFFQTGTYTIALGQTEGVFANHQTIYLLDKQTGIITNLSQGDYVFVTGKGDNDGRFEILYQPEVVLVTDDQSKEGIIVYRDNDNFIIKSPKLIKKVEVYDASGKLITVLQPNKKQGILDATAIINGMYVLRITNIDAEVTTKKISK